MVFCPVDILFLFASCTSNNRGGRKPVTPIDIWIFISGGGRLEPLAHISLIECPQCGTKFGSTITDIDSRPMLWLIGLDARSLFNCNILGGEESQLALAG